MRLRKKPWIATAMAEFKDFVLLKPDPAPAGRWSEMFGRTAPLQVELGSGKGAFIAGIAERRPDINFVGIEGQADVLYYAAVKVKERNLPNVRLLVADVATIGELFAPREVDRLYINFCDPWPKNRHAKRRLTYRTFLAQYRIIMAPSHRLCFKTDNRALFEFSLAEFAAAGLLVENITYDLAAGGRTDNIRTEYEIKFSARGEKIHRCEVIFP